MGRMTKKQADKFAKVLAALSKTDEETARQAAEVGTLYSSEATHYELQAVYNFYRARIEPFIAAKETTVDFDARYREWRFKDCSNCGDSFAYAYTFDGITTCSLDCAEQQLAKIGIVFSRHQDLKRRWSYHFHPAIVSSTALKSLQRVYGSELPEAFDPSQIDPPRPLLHLSQSPSEDTQNEQDNLSSNVV